MIKKLLIILILFSLTGCSANFGATKPLDDNLKLKATKDKILFAEDIDDVICDEPLVNCRVIGKLKQYKYISDKKIAKQTMEKDGKKYKEVKRTYNSVIFTEDKEEMLGASATNTYVGYFYAGSPFYYDEANDEWYEVDIATTTIEAYEEQTATSTEMLGASGDPIYSASGDGYVKTGDVDGCTWAATRDGTCGTKLLNNPWGASACYLVTDKNAARYNLARAFFYFDTSTIGSGSTITAATQYVRGIDKYGTGRSYAPYGSSQADTLTTADLTNISSTAYSDTPITHSSWSTTGYNSYSYNSSGLSGISKTGTTKVALLETTKDVANVAPTDSVWVAFYMADQTGTANDPYLAVTYTEGGGGTARRIIITE